MTDLSAPPEARPAVWGGWATAGWGALIALAFVLAQTAAAIVHLVAGSSTPGADLETRAAGIVSNGLLLSISTILGALVALPLIVGVIRFRRGASVREYLGLHPIGRRTVLLTTALTLGLVALSDAISLLQGRPLIPDFMSEALATAGFVPLLWLAVGIVAPIFEEVFFRGFLFEGLRRSRLGAGGATLVTALGWAMMHLQYDLYDVAQIFVLGLVLGALRVRTGSLFAPGLAHVVFNLVATLETTLLASPA